MASSSGGKPLGVKSISVPLESLLQNYVVSYGELLNPGRNKGDAEPLTEDEEESEQEDSMDEDQDCGGAETVDGATEKDKKGKKKRQQKQKKDKSYDKFVGEYDLDDPFIDDDEVAVAYESIFDLMGDEDESDGSSFDSMDENMDEGERERRLEKRSERRRAKTAFAAEDNSSKRPPLRDFYVYRGDLQVEVVSKLKDTVKKTKKTAGKTNNSNKGKKEKKTVGENGLPAAKSPPKKKKVKATINETVELTTLERILAMGEDKGESPPKKKKTVPSATATVAAGVSPSPSAAQVLNEQVSNEVSTKDNSPEKQQQRRHFDYDRVYAELEAKLALEAFIAKASALEEFEPSKFPSALRDLAAEVAVTGLRLHPTHSDVDEAVFVEMAKVVPYSVVALRKVVFKKIIPLLRQEATEKKLPALYKELAEEAATLITTNNNNGSLESISTTQPDAAGKPTKFKFSEKSRQIIYEIVKLELDLVFTGHALAAFDAAANGLAPPKALAHEMTLRRPIYQSILKEWPSNAVPTSLEVSSAYGLQKRKLERKLLKEHGLEMQAPPVEKRAQPDDVLVNVVDDEENGVVVEPQAKEPKLHDLNDVDDHQSKQHQQQQERSHLQGAILLPELIHDSNN